MVSAAVKYYVLAALEIVVAIITYIEGQPAVTETTLIGAGLLGVTMAIHDIETETGITPPAS